LAEVSVARLAVKLTEVRSRVSKVASIPSTQYWPKRALNRPGVSGGSGRCLYPVGSRRFRAA